MQNNDCIHNFSNWKKQKEQVIDCESMEENSPIFFGNIFVRRCKDCGYAEEKIEKIDKKNKGKKLSYKRK